MFDETLTFPDVDGTADPAVFDLQCDSPMTQQIRLARQKHGTANLPKLMEKEEARRGGYLKVAEATDAMLDKFVGAGFLYAIDFDFKPLPDPEQKSELTREYLEFHPLFALLLRDSQQRHYRKLLLKCRKLAPRYFASRVRGWPFDQFYFKEAWDLPRRIIDTEYLTFLSISYFILQLDVSMIRTTLLVWCLQVLPKGLLVDRSRQQLLAVFWETAKCQFIRESDAYKRSESAIGQNRVFEEVLDSDSENEWLHPSVANCTEVGNTDSISSPEGAPNKGLDLLSTLQVRDCPQLLCSEINLIAKINNSSESKDRN